MQKNRYAFVAVFNYAEDGISISFPDLPGCLPCAKTDEEALKNAKEALGLHLWGMEQDNEEIPEPSTLKNIKLKDGELPVLIDVFMPSVREKLSNASVKKTLTVPAWLARQADEDDVNYSKILQNGLIQHLGLQHSAEVRKYK